MSMRRRTFGPALPMFSVRDCARPSAHTEDESNLIAAFAPGHKARAAEGGLTIHNPEGEKIATFHGPHRATTGDSGELRIHRNKPTTDHQLTPRDVNQINQEAYKRRLV